MEQTAKINKAKLAEGLHLEVEYSIQQADGLSNVSQECSADVHQDLRLAFKALAPHLARLTEQYESDGTLTKNIECRGFSLKGVEDKAGFVLTGIRTLSTGRTITLNSSFMKFADENYTDMEDLQQRVTVAQKEVSLYLFDNKHQPNNQISMEFPEQVATEETEEKEH